jgi:hypothetical protein
MQFDSYQQVPDHEYNKILKKVRGFV